MAFSFDVALGRPQVMGTPVGEGGRGEYDQIDSQMQSCRP